MGPVGDALEGKVGDAGEVAGGLAGGFACGLLVRTMLNWCVIRELGVVVGLARVFGETRKVWTVWGVGHIGRRFECDGIVGMPESADA